MNAVPEPIRLIASSLAERFVFMFNLLKPAVAAHFRSIGPATGTIWNHLNRTARILARLLGMIAAGRLPAERQRQPRPGSAKERPPSPYALPARVRLPATKALLLHHLKHHAALHTQALEDLLANPDIRALFALCPAALRRLRPLARLLAVPVPAELQPPGPPKPERPARPPRHRPPPPAPGDHYLASHRFPPTSIIHPRFKFS